jgi:SAM-dependent methyltransferase
VAALYAEVRDVLKPGGVFVNADHMPDDGLSDLSKRLRDRARERRDARYATGAATSWPDWWAKVAGDDDLAPLLAERERIYPSAHHSEWTPPVSWHLEALRAAGYTETGLLWRGGTDAAVTGAK